MITLDGIAKQPGVAIAVAAVVDEKNGINAVSHALLMDGISALRNGLRQPDYPEAVMACDKIALGATMRIPGINMVGIAAESDSDIPDLQVEVPCVIGVSELLSSINEGDILIVDGYKGVVHIDPDPLTLIHYQQAEEHRHLREKVFISFEHIPARTQSGETVYVYARMSDESQLALALSAGADGLMMDLRNNREDLGALSGCVLREAAGKPVTFVVEFGCEEILRAAMVYCTPGQVTLASENSDLLASQVESALDRVVLEALQLDVDPPQVNLGSFALPGGCAADTPVVIDCIEVATDLPDVTVDTIVVIGRRIDTIGGLVNAGVRRVAVDPGVVSDAKYAILQIGLEDEA